MRAQKEINKKQTDNTNKQVHNNNGSTDRNHSKNSNRKLFCYLRNYILAFILLYIVGTLIFIGSFHTQIASNIHVLMYRGIVLLLLTTILLLIALLVLRKRLKNRFDIKDIILVLCMYCCINMVLFTLLPVTVERSASVFMLSYMDESKDTPLTQSEMETVF